MKRKNYFFGIIFMLIFTIFSGGCSTNRETKTGTTEATVDTEKSIIKNSKKVLKAFEIDDSLNLNIEKKSDRFLMYPDGYESSTFTMLIPENFYEQNNFEIPEVEEKKLPNSSSKLFKKAQQIVLNYIDNSSKIKESDKKVCKETVEKVTLHYCTFISEEYNDIGMVTIGSDIYINSKLEKYISEYTYLHELIHVTSNVTNIDSKYEYSSYRSSKLNEAITDLIAIELAKENEISGYEVSGYQSYYEPAYYMIAKFDMLETYFYSDGYQEIISKVGQNQLDLYILLVDNFEDGKCDKVIYYLINEFLK